MQTQLRYFHAQLWLHGYWLPGDPRGFRDADHRIHSSGDYKHRPPVGEHARLHQYNKGQMKFKPAPLAGDEQVLALDAICHWFSHRKYEPAAVAVGPVHTHLLGQLPFERVEAAMGWLKKYVSQRLGKTYPTRTGGLFAARGEPKLVRTFEHFGQTHRYVLDHVKEGAVVWGQDGTELARLWNTLR